MCGIAGAVAFRDGARPDRERLCAMAGLMAHRGPDGEGFWADPRGRAAFAHRRLSIIDIAGGRQPMCSDDGQIALVFNGEIYNYRELRRSLSDQGVQFHTVSDTEVLLRMYERYGSEAVRYLRGMFAFAVWDGRRGELVLARDRVGKKPLFYALEEDGCYFASTLGALRDTDPRARRVNLGALDAFLTLGYVPAPQSIWDGISKLPAGTLLRVSSSGARSLRYWALEGAMQPFAGRFADSAALAVWLLARETRKHVTVVLTGDGGDEGFGGYDWYRTALRLKRLRSAVPTGVLRLGATVRGQRPWVKRVKRAVGTLALDEPERFAALRMYVRDEEAQTLYAGDLLQTRRDGGDGVRAWLAQLYRSGNGSALRRMRLVDVSTYLADCLMPKVDVP